MPKNVDDKQKHDLRAEPAPAAAQRVELEFRLGEARAGRITVQVTPAGLLAIGGLVSSILLSTAMIVRAARARPRTRGLETPKLS